MFLFKNKAKENGSEKPDTTENPITYDDACEEVYEQENSALNAEKEA